MLALACKSLNIILKPGLLNWPLNTGNCRLIRPKMPRFIDKILLLLAGLALLASHSGITYATTASRDELVSIIIYRLAEYVRWANSSKIQQYHIHLIDDDPAIASQLTSISLIRKLHGKPFVVSRSASPEIPGDVNLLYLSKNKAADYPGIRQKLSDRNVLIVSDSVSDDRNILLNITDLADGKIGFKINKANIINQNLGVDPDIILLGGTEIDVALLYRKGQLDLNRMQSQLSQFQKEIEEISKEKQLSIASLKEKQAEFKSQSDILVKARQDLKNLQSTIDDQQRRQDELSADLEKTTSELFGQETRLQAQAQTIAGQQLTISKQESRQDQLIKQSLAQEKNIKEQSASLDQRRIRLDQQQREIEVRSAILDQQKTQIAQQSSVIDEHKITISDQDKVLSERGEVIASQKIYLLLLSVAVLMAFLLVAIIYRSNRHNKRLTVKLTEQRDLLARTSRELRAAKDQADSANLAKSTFLANMSHELRTPLNAVLGFSDFMARDNGLSQEQRKNIGIINRSGKHLLAMINDVLDLAKIESGVVELEPEIFNLESALKEIYEVIEFRALDKGLKMTLDIDPRLPPYIKLDSIKLRQILINLLSNALKFTRRGGIRLTVKQKMVSSDQRISFEVQDTGIGIVEDELENIFDPFVQAAKNSNQAYGTGLGLAISRQFVQLMGGDIEVTSTFGKGSIFHFDLPLTAAEVTRAVVLPFPRRVVGLEQTDPEWRILVVEDHRASRLLLRGLLQSVGFQVKEAVNGAESLDMFEQYQPHLVCMDIRMPVMDGFEATKRIRQLPGGDKVKIIAVTADVLKGQRERVIVAGCDEILFKPYRVNELYDVIGRYLNVHYTYECEGAGKNRPVAKLEIPDFIGIPDHLLESLVHSARRLDHAHFQALLSELKGKHDLVCRGLSELADNFRYDDIIDLLTDALNDKEKIV